MNKNRPKQRGMTPRVVVIGLNWLGDAVMSEPTLRRIKEYYRDCHLAVVTKSAFAGLYECISSVDETISWDAEQPRAGLARRLKEKNFDLAMILPRSFHSAVAPFRAGIPVRVGYSADWRRLLLTDPIKRRKDLLNSHRVGYYMHLLRIFGLPDVPTAPVLSAPPAVNEWLEQTIPADRPILAINPGATYGPAKQWAPDRFASVATSLIQQSDVRIVLVGGPAEASVGHQIAEQINNHDRCLDLSGKTTIPQLVGLLKKAELIVTNDTGPMHVAAAVDTPIVAIFGPTDPIETPPFGDLHSIVQHKVDCSPCFLRECPIEGHPCMSNINVNQVLEAAGKWIRSE